MIKKRGTDKLDRVLQDRASSPPNQQFYRDGHLLVDLRDRVVMLDSQILTLTRTEYRLLALFVEHAGDVVPRRVLLMLTPTVNVHLRRLRKKTRSIRRPVHRNRLRDRIPLPARARALGLWGASHGERSKALISAISFSFGRFRSKTGSSEPDDGRAV